METRDVERLGSALTRMARELAETRREILRLKRENAALRTQLEGDGRAAAVDFGRPSANADAPRERESHAA